MTFIVLDTNILVSALWNGLLEGKPAMLLELCMTGRYRALHTLAIMTEYENVLARPKFGFASRDIESVLNFFRLRGLSADPLFESVSRPRCIDPDDQKFYDASCYCDALLITGNKKHYPNDDRVLSPTEFFEHRTLREKQSFGARI